MNKEKQQKQQEYAVMVQEASPSSEIPLSAIKAFAVGGLICTLGEGIAQFGMRVMSLTGDEAYGMSTLILVFLGSLLTGLGWYDKIGKFAGAGSVVPITGFANSIVAPAMEFRREGLVMGVGAKLFALAGPVLVYGTVSSVIIGLIYFLFGRWLL